MAGVPVPEPKSPMGDPPAILGALFESLGRAVEEARTATVDISRAAVPELPDPRGPIPLTGARDADIVERLLAAYEEEFARLCAAHDYRLLLYLSRLCAGLPQMRVRGESVDEIRVRCQTADFAVLAYGARAAADPFELRDGVMWLGEVPGDAVLAVARLHRLSYEYRGLVQSLITLNYLREFSREMREKGRSAFQPAEIALGLGPVAVHASERAMRAERLFWKAYTTQDSALSRWGFAAFESSITMPALIWMLPVVKRYEGWTGDVFLEHSDRGLGSLYAEGCRYRALFERKIGMPPEHLCAIIEGLSQFAFRNETGPDYQYSWWFALTGTMLVQQSDIRGGILLDEAQKALSRYYPGYAGGPDLAASLERFVSIASSADKSGSYRLRGMRPVHVVLGEEHQSIWMVDYCASMAFVQDIVDLFGVSRDSATADPPRDDAYVRTAVFDRQLAQFLESVAGVELAFPELRRVRDAPNIVFSLSSGGEQEVDVPLRVGPVFLPVQTWTSVGNAGIDEGEYEALRDRWIAVKGKLDKTDKLYGSRLRSDPGTRALLRERGIRYVLPVFCTPHPEPVATDRRKYWLRQPSSDNARAVHAGNYRAVPRVLTGGQLAAFLSDADERELEEYCRWQGWIL